MLSSNDLHPLAAFAIDASPIARSGTSVSAIATLVTSANVSLYLLELRCSEQGLQSGSPYKDWCSRPDESLRGAGAVLARGLLLRERR